MFDAPTPAGLAARLAGGPGARAAGPPRRPEQMPLSFAQQRLWFIAQLEGPSATYNTPLALRLNGDLDTAALETALGDVDRPARGAAHGASRVADGQPYQQVLDIAELDWQLPVTPVAEQELAAAVAGIAAEPFDLAAQIPVPGAAAGGCPPAARAGAGAAPHRDRRLVDRAS